MRCAYRPGRPNRTPYWTVIRFSSSRELWEKILVAASTKAFVCSILLMLVVMGLLFMMSVFKFQSTLTGLVQNRLTVVGESIADSLEGAVDLGLSLFELHTADDLIARARENDPGIEAIDIFDPRGRVLFSTAPDRVGNPVTAKVVETQARTEGRNWGFEDDVLFASGVTLTDSIGQTIGGVLFTYSKAEFRVKVRELTTTLLRNMTLIFSVFAPLAFFGIRMGFRGLDLYMGQIDRAMEAFPDPAVDTQTGSDTEMLEATLPDPEVLERKLKAAAHQMEQARCALASAEGSR